MASAGDDPEYFVSLRAAVDGAGCAFVADGRNLNDVSAVIANPAGEAILVAVRIGDGEIRLETEIGLEHEQYPAVDFVFSPDVQGCWPDINGRSKPGLPAG